MGKLDQLNGVDLIRLFRASELREKMGLVLKQYPLLVVEDILEIAGVVRMDVKNLFYCELPEITDNFHDSVNGACNGILNGSIIPDHRSAKKTSVYEIESIFYKPFLRRRVIRTAKKGPKYTVDQGNFCEFINFLRSEFPGYFVSYFEKQAKVDRGRIKGIMGLNSQHNVYAFPDEMDRLRQLYRELKKSHEERSLSKMRNRQKEYCYLAHQVRQEFGLSNEAIACMLDMKTDRLLTILYSGKSITAAEMRRLDRLRSDFENRKFPFMNDRVTVDKDNLSQLVQFLKNSFFGLTQLQMERLCGMREELITHCLNRHEQQTIPRTQLEKLCGLHDLLIEKPQLYQSKVRVDKEGLNDLFDKLSERLVNLFGSSLKSPSQVGPKPTRVYIAHLLYMKPVRLAGLRQNKDCRYYRSEEFLRVQEVERHLEEGTIDDILKGVLMKAG